MDKESKELLESLQEGEESSAIDLTSDIFQTKFTLSEEQSNRPGVLCTLEGIGMGPFDEENGNGRDYSVEVPKVGILGSEYVTRMMKNKTLLGEPHHPKDRNEVWTDMVSHSITDMWMSEDNKYLMIRIDVLDTPNGRILKTLSDYGCTLGTSARASGKTRKLKGRLTVVPEAYNFKTFDIVTNPGFADARLHSVNEEVVDSSNLLEELEKLTESTDLGVLKSVKHFIEYCEDDDVRSLLPLVEERISATDNSEDEDNSLVEELTEELNKSRQKELELKEKNSQLTSQVVFLKESLSKKSVSEREEVLTEDIINLKRTVKMKEENLRQVHEDVFDLMSKLDESRGLVKELKSQVVDLTEVRRVATETIRSYRVLNEELSEKLESLNEESLLEEKSIVEEATVRRKRIGIGSVVTDKQSVSLNEEASRNYKRVNLIKKIGG